MLFLNPWLLVGLVGVLVPIILHLIRKQAAKPYDWGAMRFLFDTVVARKRSMEWEDVLLMAARCLLMALVALAIARPFVPSGSQVPWLFVLPVGLAGVVAFGASFVMSSLKWRWLVRGGSVLLLAGAMSLVWLEERLNLKRFQTSGRRDVALVIDASTSMSMRSEGGSAFEKVVEEARELVKKAPRGTAFSVVLGGPAPELKTATPLTHRADVLGVLDSLVPVGGPFRAHEALGMATLSLAEGQGSTKDILVLSDGQRLGWKLDQPSSWGSLGDAWEGLESDPRLLIRAMSPPAKIRNVAVAGIELSREIVGMDRAVTVRVRVGNTGTELVTPGELVLQAGNLPEKRKGLGQLLPGEETVVDFDVLFRDVGPQVVVARIEGEDDLKEDDQAERVVRVTGVLPVLLVDGNAEAGFFERATGYLGLALVPGSSDEQWLMEPRMVDAAGLASTDLSRQAVVVLGDVPRLPPETARNLANFVLKGGGLLVLAGEKFEEEFYRNWSGGDGPVMPLELGAMTLPENGVTVVASSLAHPALRVFRGKVGKDLGEVNLTGYWRVGKMREGAVVAGRYSDGEVFLGARDYGQGRVMSSTCGWDARMGNLPARPSFVALAHEVVSWLAAGGEARLNVDASWSPTITLPGGGGLRGRYYRKDHSEWVLQMDRIDPMIDFDWGAQAVSREMPKDNFRVIWEGGLLPKQSGEYLLQGWGDDKLTLWLDGTQVFSMSHKEEGKAKIRLEAGELVTIKVEFEENYGEAHVRLSWTRPDGVKEVVPTACLLPVGAEQEDVLLGKEKAVDPAGQSRNVEGVLGKRGRLIKVAGSALPGAYEVGVPKAFEKDLVSGKVPLVVKREVEESQFVGFNDDDRSLIRREADLVEVGSVSDILSVFHGRGFGRELWKILTLAALGVFLIEGLLARWVSKSRKAGEEIRVDFEHRGEVSEEFLQAAKEVKK